MRKSRSILGAATLLLAGLGLAACSAGEGTAAEAKQQQALGHRGPPGTEILEAVRALPLRDGQRAEVERLVTDVKRELAPLKEAHAALALELAAQVRAGQVDRDRITPRVEAMARAAEGSKTVMQTSLGKLHALLDGPQRAELVAALQALHEAHGGGPGRLHALAEELGLSVDQRDRIKAAVMASLPAGHPGPKGLRKLMHQHLKAAARAFVGGSFDPASLHPGPGLMPPPGARGERLVALVEAALPVLTAEQRVKLADHLTARARPAE
jgi:Spy/CpxP family protein refolding chaperone